MFDDLTRVERHEQALAGPLRVPDHPGLAVTARCSRCECTFDRLLYGMELVVTREDFGHAPSGVTEDDEISDQIEEAAAVENALESRLQFRRSFRGGGV